MRDTKMDEVFKRFTAHMNQLALQIEKENISTHKDNI